MGRAPKLRKSDFTILHEGLDMLDFDYPNETAVDSEGHTYEKPTKANKVMRKAINSARERLLAIENWRKK